jgi:hypothetical protein
MGITTRIIKSAKDVLEALVEIQIFREGVSDYQLCAVGVIRYRDGNGVARDTGFFSRTFNTMPGQ